MRVVVVGATGHIGSYLVPRLVAAGHQVVALSRGSRRPYHPHPAWQQVERVDVDREAEDAAGSFAGRLADLRPDAVVDLICFTADSARQLLEVPRDRLGFLLHCGTIWVHGPATEVPVVEEAAREAFGEYGTAKAEIEHLLLTATRRGGLPSAVLHPGHICGPGWPVINPAGNLDPAVWTTLARGGRLLLPNFGLETLHHVHADDVAQAFELALSRPAAAIGEGFHVTSGAALTLRGYATAVAGWFGRPADLEFAPWPEFERRTDAEQARTTWEHIARSPAMSIAKAADRLGYRPRYSSLQAVAEAVRALAADGAVDLDGRPVPQL